MNDCLEIVAARVFVYLRVIFDTQQLTILANDLQYGWVLWEVMWNERYLADHIVFELFSCERPRSYLKEPVFVQYDRTIFTEDAAFVTYEICQLHLQPRSRREVGRALHIQSGRVFVVFAARCNVERRRCECFCQIGLMNRQRLRPSKLQSTQAKL